MRDITIGTSSLSREKIIALLSQDNSLSAAALAERIGITPKAVEKHIAKMKAEGILKRVGPDKGGHWRVVEQTEGHLKVIRAVHLK